MSSSLRDQLIGLGFKPSADSGRKGRPGGPKDGRDGRGGKRPAATVVSPRLEEEIDLARAYALRAQKEKEERLEAERRKQKEARQRREARAKLAELLQGKALNVEDAEIPRHFEYGGKIKRVYVTPEQLKALNAGELGVVQLNGRYLLVTAEVLAKAESIFPDAVALKVDPGAPDEEDEYYSDPKYRVPDDLVW